MKCSYHSHLLELKLTYTTNIARFTSYLERCVFFHLYVATFQQHLHMVYTSLSWNDVRLHEDRLHEFGYPLSIICHKWILICSVCTDCRSCLLFSLMTCYHMWHMSSFWRQQHHECHSWNWTLFTIFNLRA